MSNLELALVAIRDHELTQMPAEAELHEVVSLSHAFERRMKKLWRSKVSNPNNQSVRCSIPGNNKRFPSSKEIVLK